MQYEVVEGDAPPSTLEGPGRRLPIIAANPCNRGYNVDVVPPPAAPTVSSRQDLRSAWTALTQSLTTFRPPQAEGASPCVDLTRLGLRLQREQRLQGLTKDPRKLFYHNQPLGRFLDQDSRQIRHREVASVT